MDANAYLEHNRFIANGPIERILAVIDILGTLNEKPISTDIIDHGKGENGFKIVSRVYDNRIVLTYTFNEDTKTEGQKAFLAFKDARNETLISAFKVFAYKLSECAFHDFENGTLILPLTPEFGGPYVG